MPTKPKETPKPWIPKKEEGAFARYGKKNKDFYNSTAWKRIRVQVLQRDDYTCVKCREQQKISEARIVDHIIPINKDEGLRLTLHNLQSLCIKCNAKKTAGDRKAP